MELLHDGEVRYTLHTERVGAALHAFVLSTRQPQGETLFPRIGDRYDLPGTFPSGTAAFRAAMEVASRLAAHEISSQRPDVKKVVGEYTIVASAAYQVEAEKWEPLLRIQSRRKVNKGAVQDFESEVSVLRRNLCPTAARATDFALEHGERMVRGLAPGLNV
jgi:hypothetical protein